MLRISIFISLVFLLAACNDDGGKPVSLLNDPPYHTLTEAIDKGSSDPQLYLERGELLASNRQPALAEADFRKAWELRADRQTASRLVRQMLTRDVKAARQLADKAATRDTVNLVMQLEIADHYLRQNELNQAIEILDATIRNYPSFKEAALMKSAINANPVARLDLIYQDAFEKADNGDPRSLVIADSLIGVRAATLAKAFFVKGVYFASVNDYNRAIVNYDSAIVHDYQFGEAYINKGIAYFDQKRYDAALALFERTTGLFPTYAEAYYWRGKTEEAMGRKEDARTDYQQALNFDKEHEFARKALNNLK